MRIVITLLFDPVAEAAVRHLWQILETDQPLQDSARYPPHITLTVYDVNVVDPYITALQSALPRFSPFLLRLDVLGIFPETKVLFLAPRMTKALMNIHREIIETFEDKPIAAHLLPNQWQPHCTLVSGVSQNRLIEAINLCQLNWKPVEAECLGIGIRVIPETVNHWYGALG